MGLNCNRTGRVGTGFVLMRIAVFVAAACGITNATAADYPYRPIRFIVPSAAGGAADINARLLAAELSRLLAQQIVVDNRPGAGGSVAYELAAKAGADPS